MVRRRLNSIHFAEGLESLYKYRCSSDEQGSQFRHLLLIVIGMILDVPCGLKHSTQLAWYVHLKSAFQMKQAGCHTMTFGYRVWGGCARVMIGMVSYVRLTAVQAENWPGDVS